MDSEIAQKFPAEGTSRPVNHADLLLEDRLLNAVQFHARLDTTQIILSNCK